MPRGPQCADFLVIADAWNANHSGPPELIGAAVPFVREPESVRIARILHIARVGMEGEPQRCFCELAPQCLV